MVDVAEITGVIFDAIEAVFVCWHSKGRADCDEFEALSCSNFVSMRWIFLSISLKTFS